jgi:CRP-like cAMP-binding protein
MVSDMNDAIDTFLNSVKSLCPKVTEVELAYLESGLTVRELKAKHFFIHANTIQKEIGFINSGLIRAFYIDQNGNEISVNFFRENRYATHYPAFITQTPSKYYFQCIEPTTIVTVSYKHIQEGYEQFPIFERYGKCNKNGSKVFFLKMPKPDTSNLYKKILIFLIAFPCRI